MTTTRSLGLAATLCALALLSGCERPAANVTGEGAALAQEKGCIACHGLNGKGTGPTFPNLGGQWTSYLRDQLLKYRVGDRVNAIMNGQAAGLSDHEIDVLAAYYAAQ
jgi:cytochrome c553